jgi:hypothetical protein
MKRLLMIAALLAAARSAGAWEFARNPDRFPSVGFSVTNSYLSGRRYEDDLPGGAPDRVQSGKQELSGYGMGLDARLPLSDQITVGVFAEQQSLDMRFGRDSGPFSTGRVYYRETAKMEGYKYGVTARLYFSK